MDAENPRRSLHFVRMDRDAGLDAGSERNTEQIHPAPNFQTGTDFLEKIPEFQTRLHRSTDAAHILSLQSTQYEAEHESNRTWSCRMPRELPAQTKPCLTATAKMEGCKCAGASGQPSRVMELGSQSCKHRFSLNIPGHRDWVGFLSSW